MEIKKYSSYAQIELELEILKVERTLNLQRIVLNTESIKECLLPENLMKIFFGYFKSIFSNYSGTIFNIVIPILIKWILNRKRVN